MSSVRGLIKSTYAIGDVTGHPPALVSGDMSADIIGPVTQIDKIDQMCFDVTWTSSDAIGTISIQGSVSGQSGTFKDLTFDPALAQPTSNNGAYLVNLALIPFPYIRLKYTRTSGSGTLVVYLSAKGF